MLKEIRERENLTQSELAKKAHIFRVIFKIPIWKLRRTPKTL